MEKPRDSYFDNLKFVAILAIIFGHFEWLWMAHGINEFPINFVYFFHVPIMAFVAGQMSRGKAGWYLVKDSFAKYIVAFVVLQLLFNAYCFIGGFPKMISATQPLFTAWFLVAMILWKTAIAVYNQLHKLSSRIVNPYSAILLSVIIAAGASLFRFYGGLQNSYYLVFHYLPFLFIGYFFKLEWLDKLNRKWIKVLSGFLILLAMICATEFVFYRTKFMAESSDYYSTAIISFGLMLLMVSAVLALTPKTKMTIFSIDLTSVGSRTVYPFILHFPIVFWFDYFGASYKDNSFFEFVDTLARTSGNLGLTTLSLALSIGILWFTSTSTIRKLTRFFVEPFRNVVIK